MIRSQAFHQSTSRLRVLLRNARLRVFEVKLSRAVALDLAFCGLQCRWIASRLMNGSR